MSKPVLLLIALAMAWALVTEAVRRPRLTAKVIVLSEARRKREPVADNFTYRDGGAIWNAGALILRDSTITGNNGWTGGGLYLAVGHRTKIIDTLITNNTARFTGGGIYLAPGSAMPTLIRTTVTDNQPDDIVTSS